MRIRIPQSIALRPLWQIDALGAAVVCLAAGLWYFAGLQPLSDARAAREELEQKVTMQQEVAQERTRLAETQERQLKKIKEDIATSSINLLAVEKINSHVSELTRAAGDSGLRVDEIKPSQPVALTRFTTVPIRLSGGGDYRSVTGFFRTLRRSHRDTGITGFKLQSQGAAGVPDSPELRFEVDLVWYAGPRPKANKK